MTKRWIPTYCGQIVDLLDPQPETLWAEDAIHALSRIVRCAAHVGWGDKDYTVADHSVLVASILADAGCPVHVQFAGCLHDAIEEPWIGDITSPLKLALEDRALTQTSASIAGEVSVREALRSISAGFEAAGRVAFHIPELTETQQQHVKDADLAALVREQWEFFQWTPKWQASADNCARESLPAYTSTGLSPRSLLCATPWERELQLRAAWHRLAARCGHHECGDTPGQPEELGLDGKSICARCGRALGPLQPYTGTLQGAAPAVTRSLSKMTYWHRAANQRVFRLCGECAGPTAYLVVGG